MRRIYYTLFWLLLPLVMAGQLAPVTSQYILNPMTINAGYAGNRGALNIAAFYRHQWVGVTGAPETMTLAFDAPFFDSKLGLGLVINNDKIGVTRQTRIGTYYAYKIGMEDGNLSFGLGAGLIATNTAWSDLIVIDPGDEEYLVDSKVLYVPDFNFGLYYSNKNFFAGVSIPRLLGYEFNIDENKYSLSFNISEYSYLLNTGYVFDLNRKWKFFPSTLVTIASGRKILYDLNAHFSFSDKFWVGGSYRNNRSVTGLFQLQLNNQLRVAYSYDFDLGELGRFSTGTHEIMIRYELRYKVDVINPLLF
jgi:type IX secretion system PorP/SprF family membrane protein